MEKPGVGKKKKKKGVVARNKMQYLRVTNKSTFNTELKFSFIITYSKR